MERRVIFVLALLLSAIPFVSSQDISGSKDHPLISRYPNSIIRKYTNKEFEEYLLPLGPVPIKGLQMGTTKSVSGKLTQILYEVPATPAPRSTLEVYKNYESALQKSGFEILFSCSEQQCGDAGWVLYHVPEPLKQRLLSARLPRKEGDVYVGMYVTELKAPAGSLLAALTVVESQPMESNLVSVNAEKITEQLTANGHIAIYGIYFDFDQTEIKPESEPAIAEIAKFLQQNPAVKIFVVGHTDSVGTEEYNNTLSAKRAQAVVEMLVSKYEIERQRLTAKGLGFYAPVASNKTDEGRAKNRRVELIEP